MSVDAPRFTKKYPTRAQLIGPLPNDVDKTEALLETAEAAFDDQARKHPEVDPKSISSMLTFTHETLGLSTLDSTTSFAPLGELLSGSTSQTAEDMMKRGTDFGNPTLNAQVRFLYAGVSMVRDHVLEVTQAETDAGFAGEIRGILLRGVSKFSGMSPWDLYAAGMPDMALSGLQAAIRKNTQEQI